MTPVSSVANSVTANRPPAPAGDAAAGDGQAAFLDALLTLIADLAGVPETTEAAPAAGSATEDALPSEEVAGTEATHEGPEHDWAEGVLVPAAPTAIPAADAPANPFVEPTPAPPAEGVSDTGRSGRPPTGASRAPAVPPESLRSLSADAADVDESIAATDTDRPASRSGPSTATPDPDGPPTAADTESPAPRRAEVTRNDREPVAGVATSTRPEHGAPPTVDSETIAAVRADLAIPASAKRVTTPPAPVISDRSDDASMPVAAPGENAEDTATPEASDLATTGKMSPADLADADVEPTTLSLRDVHETSTPSQAASRPAITVHDATAAAAAQSGVTQAVTGPASHTPTAVVAVSVTAEQLAEVVSREVVRATPKGEHRLEITLHPPELGRVEVNMVVGRDSVHAHLVAHTEGARDLLTHHLTDLREQLVAQGFADPRLSVDLRHGSGDRGGYRADRRSDSRPREDREVAPAAEAARIPEPRDRHALHIIA